MFWTFPNDRRLAGLRVFDRRSGALEALVGAPVARTRLMAYAPERAATAECRDADGRVLAYVKVHWDAAERELANAEAAAAAVGTADPHLRLPRVLAHSLPDGALVSSRWAATGSTASTDLAPALRALGAALATLHDVRPLPERRFDRLDPERLALAAEVVGRARPDCARAAEALHARLARRAPPESEPVHLHGDANLRNALLDGGRVGARRPRGRRRRPGRRRPRLRDRRAAGARRGWASGRCSTATARLRAGAVGGGAALARRRLGRSRASRCRRWGASAPALLAAPGAAAGPGAVA